MTSLSWSSCSRTIEHWAARCLEELRALIAHCLSPEAGGYTPADFPKARLAAGEIAALLAELAEGG